jgi:hypothetical protein
MLSQTDNEMLALGLKEDVAKEEPITVAEDDPVIIIVRISQKGASV